MSLENMNLIRFYDYQIIIGMDCRLSATEAARAFSDILNRTRYQGTSFVIERGGEAVARIVPVGPPPYTLGDLQALLANLPRPDPAYLDDVEAITRTQGIEEGPHWD